VWIATVVSNIGTWFQEVAAGWLMTELSTSPLLVSLVQTATTLPMLFLALPAGALADIVDRRRLLLFFTLWMAAAAGGLAAVQLGGGLGAGGLLAFVLAVSVGTAMTAPAWQAIVPELVPRSHLSAAIALNSVGINISRAIGPALAGLVVAAAGPGVAFAINAVSFFALVAVLVAWPRQQRRNGLPPEQLLLAVANGVGYVRQSPPFLAVMGRSTAFAFFAVALWSLLPLTTQQVLGADATGYGTLLGGIGLGAVAGALVLPPLRAALSRDVLTVGATLLYAAVMLGLAAAPPLWVATLLMLPAGLAWIAMLSTIHASAQFLLPAWVRARGLAVSLMVFFGSMSTGSVVWGALASALGVAATLQVAAVGLALASSVAIWLKLPAGEGPDLSPSQHWPLPATGANADDGGPVLVTVTYTVDADDRAAFFDIAQELRRVRLRDGATLWGLYEDEDTPGQVSEVFMHRTWLEHLRSHDRFTHEDLDIEQRLRALHRGDGPPAVRHLLSASPTPSQEPR
jgi:MFS family permease